MNSDDFEEQLQRQPFRVIPPEWRAEILHETQAFVAADVRRLKSNKGSGEEDPSFLTSAATPWWREWLWPSPIAWAGLAAAWIAIAVLNVADVPRRAELAKASPRDSLEAEHSLAAHRRELTLLLDSFIEPVTAPKTESSPHGGSAARPGA